MEAFRSEPVKLQDGIMDTQSPQSREWGVLWYAAKKSADFTLRFEFKRTGHNGRNSGVFVRFDDPGSDPLTADYPV